jgi:hypothetical protein
MCPVRSLRGTGDCGHVLIYDPPLAAAHLEPRRVARRLRTLTLPLLSVKVRINHLVELLHMLPDECNCGFAPWRYKVIG